MRKQQTRLICAALLAASLAALRLAGTALGRIGKTRLFSFIESASAENGPPDQLVHTRGVTESRKVFPAHNKPFFPDARPISSGAASTNSENSKGNKFCEQTQLTDCLA